jgi:RHS repeat-associated protein
MNSAGLKAVSKTLGKGLGNDMRALLLMVIAIFMHGQALASEPFYSHFLKQPETLAPAKAGTVTGSLSAYELGAVDIASGSLSHNLPLEFRTERGPLLVSLSPVYSMHHGLSEWGLGWQLNLSITRSRTAGHIDYKDDQFNSPWGLLTRGHDAYWYPEGLKSKFRVEIHAHSATAYGPNGETYYFEKVLHTDYGPYSYHLTKVVSLNGRETVLAYEQIKNVVYLKTVRYGGRGNDFAYSVEFEYEALPAHQQWISFKSKASQVFSQAVRQIKHQLLASGRVSLLWTYVIDHEDNTFGPSFFLSQLTKVYPSGAREPAVRFDYHKFHLQELQYGTSKNLEPLRYSGLRADTLSFYDYNQDGLVDIESAYDHRLFLQGTQGFSEQKQFVSTEGNVCLQRENTLNRARKVLRLKGRDAEPSVFHTDLNGLMTICDLNGQVQIEKKLPFIPLFNQSALLLDMNGDDKPDLYHLHNSGYSIYANRSVGDRISFVLEKTVEHKPLPSLSSLWGTDINGDGYIDIVAIGGTTIKVYMGKGNFDFTPTFLTMPLEREDGSSFDPNSYTPTFADINQDGLTDVLFTQGKSLYTFINTGRSFRRIQHDAFEQLAIEGEVLTQNIMGSGEQMIFRAAADGVRYARLHDANTNLLKKIHDGKGSSIQLSYRYFTGEGSRYYLGKVLENVTIFHSQEGEVSSRIEYHAPYYRSQSTQRLAFGRVNMSSARSEESFEYHNNDYQSLLRSSTVKSRDFSHILLRKDFGYKTLTYNGLETFVRSQEQTYYVDTSNNQSSSPVVQEVLEWTDQLCEKTTRKTVRSQTMTSSQSYVDPGNFQRHILCLPESLAISNPSGQIYYQANLSYNAQLMPEQVQLTGRKESQVLQHISYDTLQRVAKLSAADGTFKIFEYLGDSDLLQSITDETGVKTAQDAFNDRDLAGLHWTLRGKQRYRRYSTYNGLDQLASQWDSLFGSINEPMMRFAYGWPTEAKAGSIEVISNNLQSGDFRKISLISGSGRTIGGLEKNTQGDWVATGLSQFIQSDLKERSFAPQLVGNDWTKGITELFKDPVAESKSSILKFPPSSWNTVQKGVIKRSAVRLSVRDGLLFVEEATNSSRIRMQGFDSELRKTMDIDEEGLRYSYDYDDMQRLKRVVMPSGKSLRVEYDDLGRVGSIHSSAVGSLHKAYNDKGLLSEKIRRDASGSEVFRWVYKYDEKARLIYKIATAQGKNLAFTYSYDGNMPNGSVVENQLGYLSSVTADSYHKTFVYDLKGRLQQKTIKIPSESLTLIKEMSYDALDRITKLSVQGVFAQQSTSYELAYQYDELGRQKSFSTGREQLRLAYNALNQIEELSGAESFRYQLDEKTGRLLGFSYSGARPLEYRQNFSSFAEVEEELFASPQTQAKHAYTYTQRGFLESADLPGGNELFSYASDGYFAPEVGALAGFDYQPKGHYQFDGIGRLIRRGPMALSYGPHGQATVITSDKDSFEILYDEQDLPLVIKKNGSLYRFSLDNTTYVDGHWIEPLKLAHHVVGWLKNGSFEAKTYDFRGTLIGEKPSSPYGKRNLTQTRVMDYAGHPSIPELGLVAMGVRLYDPQLGQFISPDPYFLENPEACLGSPLECNLYSYAKNNPLKYTDPTGQWAFLAVLGVGLASDFIFNPSPANAPGADGQVDTSMPPETKLGLGLAATSLARSTVHAIKNLPTGVKAALSKPFLAGSETGAVSLGRSAPLSATVDDLSRAAGAADRGGLTAAGRALQKHGGREGSAFPTVKGNPDSINRQGQQVVDDILTSPGSTITTRHHARYGDVTEIRASDGRGVRYDKNNNFMGFLEPNK